MSFLFLRAAVGLYVGKKSGVGWVAAGGRCPPWWASSTRPKRARQPEITHHGDYTEGARTGPPTYPAPPLGQTQENRLAG